MKRKITSDYVAGILELVGGFAVHKNPATNKKYLYFKIVTESPVVADSINYLKYKHKIASNMYEISGKKVFYVTQSNMVKRFIDFLKKYCSRNDFLKYQEYLEIPPKNL